MAAEASVAKWQGTPSSQNVESRNNKQRARIASAFSSLRQDNDTSIDFGKGRVILEEREARDYSMTGEPWIVEGAHTLYADFPRQDVTLRYTYTSDKATAQRMGLYSSRRAALSQMRKDVTQRIKNLSR